MATIAKRTTRKGKPTYQAQVRITGHPRQTATFDRKREAQDWANQEEARLRALRGRSTLPAAQTPLSSILQRYAETEMPKHKGASQESYRVNALARDPIASLMLDQVTSREVAAWRDRRGEKVKPATVARELQLLRSAIEVARREWGYHLVDNPAAGIRVPNADQARARRLQPGEEEYLLRAMNGSGEELQNGRSEGSQPPRNPWLRPAFLFAIETALRRSELVALRWMDVDWAAKAIDITMSKNGRSRRVALSPKARELLKGLAQSRRTYVFPITASSLSQAWSRALKRARLLYEYDCAEAGVRTNPAFLQDLRWHDLRHEAASRLVAKGLNDFEVASMTGHKDLNMLKRYTHVDASDLADRL